MMLVVLCGLLFWFLAGFREGVWTQYTPKTWLVGMPKRPYLPAQVRWPAPRPRMEGKTGTSHDVRAPELMNPLR